MRRGVCRRSRSNSSRVQCCLSIRRMERVRARSIRMGGRCRPPRANLPAIDVDRRLRMNVPSRRHRPRRPTLATGGLMDDALSHSQHPWLRTRHPLLREPHSPIKLPPAHTPRKAKNPTTSPSATPSSLPPTPSPQKAHTQTSSRSLTTSKSLGGFRTRSTRTRSRCGTEIRTSGSRRTR